MNDLADLSVDQSDQSTLELRQAGAQIASLEEYWAILEGIDTEYKSAKKTVKSAFDDLRWYKNKSDEAETFCKSKNFLPINVIKEARLSFSLPNKFSHDLMDLTFRELKRKANALTSEKKEKDITTERLEQESQEVLSTLKNQLKNIQNNINGIQDELKKLQDELSTKSNQVEELRSRILLLKTTRMKYVIALSAICITMLLVTKSIVYALATTFIAFLLL